MSALDIIQISVKILCTNIQSIYQIICRIVQSSHNITKYRNISVYCTSELGILNINGLYQVNLFLQIIKLFKFQVWFYWLFYIYNIFECYKSNSFHWILDFLCSKSKSYWANYFITIKLVRKLIYCICFRKSKLYNDFNILYSSVLLPDFTWYSCK